MYLDELSRYGGRVGEDVSGHPVLTPDASDPAAVIHLEFGRDDLWAVMTNLVGDDPDADRWPTESLPDFLCDPIVESIAGCRSGFEHHLHLEPDGGLTRDQRGTAEADPPGSGWGPGNGVIVIADPKAKDGIFRGERPVNNS